MKTLTDGQKLEIATQLMSNTNHSLYIEACEFMEQDESLTIDEAVEMVTANEAT